MQYVKPDVATACMGLAANMAAILLAGQETPRPAQRPPVQMGGFQGQASDIEIRAREILKLKSRINQILSFHTGRDIEQIERDSDRDFFMSPEEAMEYGLIDGLFEPRKPSSAKTPPEKDAEKKHSDN